MGSRLTPAAASGWGPRRPSWSTSCWPWRPAGCSSCCPTGPSRSSSPCSSWPAPPTSWPCPRRPRRSKGEREGARSNAPERSVGAAACLTAFGVILVGEFGDLTQLLTVNLVAHYHQPVSVFVGALAALVTVSAAAPSPGGRCCAGAADHDPTAGRGGPARLRRLRHLQSGPLMPPIAAPRPCDSRLAEVVAPGPRRPRLHARRRGRGPAGGGAARRSRLRRGDPSAGGLRRDRRLVRQVHPLPRGGRRGHRGGALQRRPPPRVGGEPGRLGAPRRRPGRSRRRAAGHPPALAARGGRRRARGRVVGRGRRLADGGRLLARRRSAFCFIDGGHGAEPAWADFRGLGTACGRGRAGWPSTTCSPTRPTAGARPTSSGAPRSASGEWAEDGECGSLRVLRRVAPTG